MPFLVSAADRVLTPLSRRVRVPRDLDAVTTIGHEDDPGAAGLTRADVETIWHAALDLYRTGAHPAVVLCLRRNDRVVLNRAVGHAWGNGPDDPRGAEQVLATPDTPYCVYSAAKGFTATVVHLLLDRGVLDLDDPVTDYLPGYARHGKGGTTLRHVLGHRAGVPYLPRASTDLDRLGDRDFIREQLCDLRPVTRPGTALAYHALTAGYILGEVIHVATGKPIREVLAEEILDPLGFRWSNFGVAPADVTLVAPNHVTGLPIRAPVAPLVTRALSGTFESSVTKSNDPRFLTAVVPSANTVTTAPEMARFYDLLRRGGELDGVRVMQPATVRAALRQSAHLEPDRVLGLFPVRYGQGYMLGARHVSLYGPDTDYAFGHLGLMNVIGWADPRRGLAGALITSGKALYYPGVVMFPRVPYRIAARIRPDVASFLSDRLPARI